LGEGLNYSWEVSADLKRQIRHLPPDLKCQVRAALDYLEQKAEAGKLLSDELAGYRSYRMGRYRLIYKIADDRLVLEAFGSRRDIYERFVLEIGRAKIRERSANYDAGRKLRIKSRAKPRAKSRKS
jgi:mRNA interferase RelE/StbE